MLQNIKTTFGIKLYEMFLKIHVRFDRFDY